MSCNSFTIGPWAISTTKSHILRSRCEKTESECPKNEENPCNVCRYTRGLDLPSLPEMVFPNNIIKLNYNSVVTIEFNAFDALKMVDAHKETISVAASKEWLAMRSEGLQKVKDKVKPFDWTYTTRYQGTAEGITVEESATAGIDYTKLKQQEKILFYEDLVLFEDELADNGIAQMRVKLRVMASGFFILLRYFLRVDDVLIRINDTRLYHAAQTNYITREFSIREAKLPDPLLPLELVKDINKISDYLPHKNVTIHKLTLPVDN